MKIKNYLIWITIVFGIAINSHAQNIKDVGAGVLTVLMNSPKVSSKLNYGQQTALEVVRNLLIQSSRREHELGIAAAGKTEINLQDNSGNQVQLVKDENGNVYLVQNGQIYPIQQNFVNQARLYSSGGFVSNSNPLPEFTDSELSGINGTAIKYEQFKLWKRRNFISEIEDAMGIDKYNIVLSILKIDFSTGKINYVEHKKFGEWLKSEPKLSNAYYGKKPFVCNTGGTNVAKCGFNLVVGIFYPPYYELKINAFFTCNWAEDINGDGLGLDDFHGIKRNFKEGEKLQFYVSYQGDNISRIELNINDELTGELVDNSHNQRPDKKGIIKWEGEGYANYLIPGTYSYNVKLINASGAIIASAKEKFQILPVEQTAPMEELTNKIQQTTIQDSSSDANDFLFNLIAGNIITQSEYVTINSAISGDKDAKEKASEILFNLVSNNKINSTTFKAISSAINK